MMGEILLRISKLEERDRNRDRDEIKDLKDKIKGLEQMNNFYKALANYNEYKNPLLPWGWKQ